jgi:hypothetical protein
VVIVLPSDLLFNSVRRTKAESVREKNVEKNNGIKGRDEL